MIDPERCRTQSDVDLIEKYRRSARQRHRTAAEWRVGPQRRLPPECRSAAQTTRSSKLRTYGFFPRYFMPLNKPDKEKEMSNLNSVFRTDFESFMRKCFRILNPG